MPVSSIRALSQATAPLHSELEQTPYARSLMEGSTTEVAYLGHLRAVAVILAVVERSLSMASSRNETSTVARFWHPKRQRLPWLHSDLYHFRYRLVADVAPAVDAALEAAKTIRLHAETQPAAVLGAWYVFEGSCMGAPQLAQKIESALGHADARGATYLAQLAQQAEYWPARQGELDAQLTKPDEIEAAVETAQTTYRAMRRVFEVLDPKQDHPPCYRITSLNPEAGNHPMPQDERLVRAVLRATDRCLARYPYFGMRYGPRGHCFSDSDGAWLATLPTQGAASLSKEVDWLVSLLSPRGIPGLLLREHLLILADELTQTEPGRSSEWALLAQQAEQMRRRSEAQLPDHAAKTALRSFEEATLGAGAPCAALAGQLLAAAVTDEALGHRGSVTGLMSWYADRSRLSDQWCDAATALVERCRVAAAANLR